MARFRCARQNEQATIFAAVLLSVNLIFIDSWWVSIAIKWLFMNNLTIFDGNAIFCYIWLNPTSNIAFIALYNTLTDYNISYALYSSDHVIYD